MVSSVVTPCAIKSRMRETQMRAPRIQGLPKQTFGSIEIRSRSGFICGSFLRLTYGQVCLILSASDYQECGLDVGLLCRTD